MDEKQKPQPLSQEDVGTILAAMKNINAWIDKVQQAHREGVEIDPETLNTMTYMLRYMHVVNLAVNDALLYHGDKAFRASLEFYHHLKKAAEDKVPGAEAIYNELTPLYLEAIKEQEKPNPILANLNDN